MKRISDEAHEKMMAALRAAQYEAACMEPRVSGQFARSQRAVKEQCAEAIRLAEAAQIEESTRLDKAVSLLEDMSAAIRAGHGGSRVADTVDEFLKESAT